MGAPRLTASTLSDGVKIAVFMDGKGTRIHNQDMTLTEITKTAKAHSECLRADLTMGRRGLISVIDSNQIINVNCSRVSSDQKNQPAQSTDTG